MKWKVDLRWIQIYCIQIVLISTSANITDYSVYAVVFDHYDQGQVNL